MSRWVLPRRVADLPESLSLLERVIELAQQDQSPVGYFAALYLKVGRRLSERLAQGAFRTPELMRRVDVVFVNRYLEALWQWREGQTPSGPWAVAYKAVAHPRLIVLQHLLLGMNAHIDFDLPLAVAEAVPADRLASFEPDFLTMNALLAGLMNDVERDMGEIFPLLRPLSRLFDRQEDAILGFSMRAARALAWETVHSLSRSAGIERRGLVARRERMTALVARGVLHPQPLAELACAWVRHRESGDVASRIAALRY